MCGKVIYEHNARHAINDLFHCMFLFDVFPLYYSCLCREFPIVGIVALCCWIGTISYSREFGPDFGHPGWLEEFDLAFTVCIECSCSEPQFLVASSCCNLRLVLWY